MKQYLKVFVTVTEKKNFSRAAEELHMTQPAVSQYIRQLEEIIGTRLLQRTNKYVKLNRAGEIVYHHAKEILSLYTRMQTLVDDLTEKASGTLYIGASHTFGEYVLPWMIATLKKRYPEIEPSVMIGNTEEVVNLVSSQQLEAGIVEGKLMNEKLTKQKLSGDRMVIVASPNHPLVSQRSPITKEQLSKETWLAREKGSGTREAMDEMFELFDITPQSILQFGSNQPIKEAVEAGLGISLLSHWAIQKELKYGVIKLIEVEGLPFRREFSIITNSPFKTRALELFIDLVSHHEMLHQL